MSIRTWVGAVMVMGGTACGPIPGYQMPQEEAPQSPRAPPAPARVERPARPAQEVASDTGGDPDEVDEGATPEDESMEEEVPAERPAPKPPRYVAPKIWDDPNPQPRGPVAPPERTPAPAAPEPDSGIKIVRLDSDSYYLIDAQRKLCFLRHKESMTAIDCAKIPEANAPTRQAPEPRAPDPRAPEPTRLPEPTRMPEPAKRDEDPRPTSPTPDEMARFEEAFVDIYCDRKLRDETPPESRIREHGLTTVRYEAIEAWWSGDENAWYTLTARASKSCK